MGSGRIALIVGISGQDGSYLARELLKDRYIVFGSSREPERRRFTALREMGIFGRVKIIKLSLDCQKEIQNALKIIEATEIYNLAGQTSVGTSFESPQPTYSGIADPTIYFLEAIRCLGVQARYFNACSSDCFGETSEVGADETTPFSPVSPYGVGKAAAYWITKTYRESYGLYACSGILFNHESPFRSERFLSQKVVKAVREIAAGRQKKLSIGNPNIERDWGWAPEYVHAIHKILQQKRPEDLVVATGKSTTVGEFVDLAFRLVGLDWREHVIIESQVARPRDILISRANPEKANEKLDWKPKFGVREILQEMLHTKYGA